MRGKAFSFIVIMLLSVPAGAQAEDRGQVVSVHAGWWSLEAEYRAPFGLFANVGLPWFTIVLDELTTGWDWDGAIGGAVGYEVPLSESWSLRGDFRVAFSFSHGCSCMDCEEERQARSRGFLEAGFIYRHPSGFVSGISLPLHTFDDLHEGEGMEHLFFPMSLGFTQVYLGYAVFF